MLEDRTQKFFDLISSITQHVDYKDFPHVSEKIKKAAEDGDIFSIHRQYPFLTDMFFHVIIAEFKAQSNWLDWLWINDVEQIPEEDLKKILSAKGNSDFEYKSLLEMIASCANELSIQDEKSIEEQLEVAFLKNLDEMKKISEETEPDYINNHISLAKLQLKYIKPEKRKEYLKQYIDVLKKIRKLKSVKNSEKISEIIRFFIEKYENIPLNFCNEDEYSIFRSITNNTLLITEDHLNSDSDDQMDSDDDFESDDVLPPEIKKFQKLISKLGSIHKEHNKQANILNGYLEKSGKKQIYNLWNAVNRAQVRSKTKTPDVHYCSYIKQGTEAQEFLHNMCARRFYQIDKYGSGKIPAQHLNGRHDYSGHKIDVSYKNDDIAMDLFIYMTEVKIYEYLDGNHTDTYLISILDNACANIIKKRLGFKRKFKAQGMNVSISDPAGNEKANDTPITVEETLAAPEDKSVENDRQIFIMERIKKIYPELYLYLLLYRFGVTPETLSELKNCGFESQAESLTIGQDLDRLDILEIIGKGGNAHYFIRTLKKLKQTPDFKEIPELQEVSQEIKIIELSRLAKKMLKKKN